jgi:hypothetical protein
MRYIVARMFGIGTKKLARADARASFISSR